MNDEDDLKSCNGNVKLEQSDRKQTDATKLNAILDRSWHNDPFKSSKLLKPRTDGDPLAKAELIALARRSLKNKSYFARKGIEDSQWLTRPAPTIKEDSPPPYELHLILALFLMSQIKSY